MMHSHARMPGRRTNFIFKQLQNLFVKCPSLQNQSKVHHGNNKYSLSVTERAQRGMNSAFTLQCTFCFVSAGHGEELSSEKLWNRTYEMGPTVKTSTPDDDKSGLFASAQSVTFILKSMRM